jgi:hypothetical protein
MWECGTSMVLPWVKTFTLTLLIEGPIVIWCLRGFAPNPLRLVLLVVFANCATHPIVWFVFPALPLRPWLAYALSESWATGAEALFYFVTCTKLSSRRAVLVALLANAASAGVGLLLFYFGPRWIFS